MAHVMRVVKGVHWLCKVHGVAEVAQWQLRAQLVDGEIDVENASRRGNVS